MTNSGGHDALVLLSKVLYQALTLTEVGRIGWKALFTSWLQRTNAGNQVLLRERHADLGAVRHRGAVVMGQVDQLLPGRVAGLHLRGVRQRGDRDQLVPAAELQDAQRSMTASFALSLENPSEVLNLYVLRQMYGYPADYWDKYSDRIMAVTPAQVQAVAKKYLDPAKLQIVAVGDSSKIEAGLKKIGPVEMFDDEGKPVLGSPASPPAR